MKQKLSKSQLLITGAVAFVVALTATMVLDNHSQEDLGLQPADLNIEEAEINNETIWQWVYEQKKLYEMDELEINSTLKELWQRFPDKTERLKALAILRLGTPYQLGCLGEEAGRDKDPIFRLDVTDCTAFVLTNIALLYSQNLEQAREMMMFVNYQPNSGITFKNRLHFTTDRNSVSPYFSDITGEMVSQDKLKIIEVVLNKIKADGKRLIDIDWEKEKIIKYVPSQYITKEFFASLPQIVGVAFLREGDENIGLDVRHEGFLFGNKSLFHASSIQEKVVEVDFFEYYLGEDDEPKFDGVIFFYATINI